MNTQLPSVSEDLELIPRPIVGFSEELPSCHYTAAHTHQRSQLLYAYKGVIAVSTPQGEWIAPPEKAIWIPGGMEHSSYTIGQVQNRGLFLYPSICQKLPTTCKVLGISPLLRELLEEASEIHHLYDESGRDGLLMKLLLTELEQAPVIPFSIPMPQNKKLADMCRLFLKYPKVDATIDQWASQLNMDRRKFTRHFRRDTGLSFGEWKQEACITIAIPKLTTGESVISVALSLGYESAASFSNMFKRRVGSAPSEFQP